MKPIPFLRIIIPYIFGIVVSVFLKPDLDIMFIVIIGILLLAIILLVHKISNSKYAVIILLDLFLFFIGFVNVNLCNSEKKYGNISKIKLVDTEVAYLASLTEVPKHDSKFIKCQLRLNALYQQNSLKTVNGDVIAYFKKPVTLKYLEPGKILYIKSKLLAVPLPKNPNEFNYASYLASSNVFYTTFIDTGDFKVYDNTKSNLNKIIEIGLKLKYQIVNKLRNSQLTGDAFGICSALITGYDDEIDRSVVDAFAHSGTLHVLSVSGLHTGLIYVLLNYLINLIDPYNRKKLFRFFTITIVLWSFALLTGFSAPVLRAVIMFSLLGLGKLFYRSNATNQFNILMLSAFVLLSYNPYFILNIGFLLSYCAMIGIIAFNPFIKTLLTTKNKIILYFAENLGVSVAATITTLPITLYYFKQFPVWFFACNLLVIPLSFVILLLAFISLLQIPFLEQLINYMVKFMIDFIKIFNQTKYSYIDCINFELSDAVFLTALILGISFLIKYRTYSYTLLCLLILISWQFLSLFQAIHAKQTKFICIYNVKNKCRMVVKNKVEAIYNRFDTASFNFNMKPHFTTFNNAGLKVFDYNFVQFNGKNLLVLDSAGYYPLVENTEVNSILLANNFLIDDKSILKFQNLKLIVVDASNSKNIIYNTENLCRKFGIPFYNTRLKGAYIMALK